MTKTHLLIAATILTTAAAAYLYFDLDKCKKYIKKLPGELGTSDGMPPHN